MNILSFYFGVGFHKMIFWFINTAIINSKKIMQIFNFLGKFNFHNLGYFIRSEFDIKNLFVYS